MTREGRLGADGHYSIIRQQQYAKIQVIGGSSPLLPWRGLRKAGRGNKKGHTSNVREHPSAFDSCVAEKHVSEVRCRFNSGVSLKPFRTLPAGTHPGFP